MAMNSQPTHAHVAKPSGIPCHDDAEAYEGQPAGVDPRGSAFVAPSLSFVGFLYRAPVSAFLLDPCYSRIMPVPAVLLGLTDPPVKAVNLIP